MINNNISTILNRIRELEQQLEDELAAHQERLSYQLQDHKVRFTASIRALHREYKVGLLEFFRTASIRHIITAPVIYSLIVPFVLLDLWVSIYQHLCFRAYRIPRVCRGDHIILDRHQLSYLNIIEKINCVYCGYAGGVIGFTREVAARTEQYWCPIKHARRVLEPHSSISRFADYGDAAAYRAVQTTLRNDFREDER
jgi:hypothetical protein